jgi:hypothetical protein
MIRTLRHRAIDLPFGRSDLERIEVLADAARRVFGGVDCTPTPIMRRRRSPATVRRWAAAASPLARTYRRVDL